MNNVDLKLFISIFIICLFCTIFLSCILYYIFITYLNKILYTFKQDTLINHNKINDNNNINRNINFTNNITKKIVINLFFNNFR